MRVTQTMISNNMLNNLNKSYAELDKYFNQLNTGKKINRPSDDPVAAMNGIGYRTELSRVGQYQRNTNELHNWFDNSDAALEQVTSALNRVRELAVQASNGTYGDSELENISEEVNQIKQDLIDVANTKVNDKYIFNGENTENSPIQIVEGNLDYSFDEGEVKIEVSADVSLTANVTGKAVFEEIELGSDEEGEPIVEDMFSIVQGFIDKLDGTNENGELDASIEEIDAAIDNVINQRASLGAKMNRLELVENRLGQQEVIATSTLSKNEDVNYAETITKLITQQSIHRAALSSGAQIIQPTLLDFLR